MLDGIGGQSLVLGFAIVLTIELRAADDVGNHVVVIMRKWRLILHCLLTLFYYICSNDFIVSQLIVIPFLCSLCTLTHKNNRA
jgi:hypothetical protein